MNAISKERPAIIDDDNEYNIRTREVLKEFTALGIPESEGNIVFPEGNALKNFSEFFESGKEYINPYVESPDDIRSISIDPDGIVYGGGGILTNI